MMPNLEHLAAEVEATTDEMLAACDAFKAEVLARRGAGPATALECSKAEWTLLRKLDRLYARRRSALREHRELLAARAQASNDADAAPADEDRVAEAVA
ncbi:MAG TPA: hypothetical protein VFZ93_11950 [Albitalea sp.]